MLPFRTLPNARAVCLTGLALVLSTGLGGCATSSAMQTQKQAIAYKTFSETLDAETYSAIAPAAGKESEPLIEALAGLAPEGKNFAFADDVDINMMVPVLDGNLPAAEKRAAVLAAAGLQVRETSAIVFVERSRVARPAERSARMAPEITPPVASHESQLAPSTMMSAPLLSGGEWVGSGAGQAALAGRAPAAQEIVLASTGTGASAQADLQINLVSEPVAPVMPKTEQVFTAHPPQTSSVGAAPTMLTADTKPIDLPPALPEPVRPTPQEVRAMAEPVAAQAPVVAVREMPRAVESNPTVIAASDVNARTRLDSVSGVASEPMATHALPRESWIASRGQTLRTVLEGWCNQADIQLVWDTEFDYPLSASVTLNDSFENAVRTLLSGFAAVSPQPVGRLHRQGNAGQRVLIVETRGNLYQDQ